MQSIKILNGYLSAQMDIHQGNTYRKNFGWQHFGCYHPKHLLSSDMRVFRVFLSLFSAHNYHVEIVSYCLSESSKSQNFMGRHPWIPLRGLQRSQTSKLDFSLISLAQFITSTRLVYHFCSSSFFHTTPTPVSCPYCFAAFILCGNPSWLILRALHPTVSILPFSLFKLWIVFLFLIVSCSALYLKNWQHFTVQCKLNFQAKSNRVPFFLPVFHENFYSLFASKLLSY